MKYPIIQIGDLADSEPGSFKIGPFGSSLKKDELVSSGIQVVGIENVLPNQFIPGFRKYITAEKYNDLSQYSVRSGDILVTTMGTIGRAAVVPERITTTIIDSHLFRMRVDQERVFPNFLCYAINGSNRIQQHLNQMSRGAIMDGLNTTILKECTLVLPPLPEQQRIAAILTKADRLRRLRRTACQLSDSYLQSVFLEMFGYPRTNTKNWKTTEFQDICESRLGKMLDEKQQTGKHLRPYMRNFNVQWGKFDLSNVAEMDFDEKDREEFRLRYGDVLICEGGEVGRSAIWRNQLPECYFQKALHCARPNPELANSEYVSWLMWWMAKTGGLGDFTSQVTIAHLTGEKLKELIVPVPPLADQQRFSEIANRHECLLAQQNEASRQAAHLFQSLLQRAFAGEL